MGILRKRTVSARFLAIRPKLCGNCGFPENVHIKKLGEITVFYPVITKNATPRNHKTLSSD